jgi:hypothetical protein
MITAVLLVAAVVALPTILVLGVLFVLGSAVAALIDGATSGLVHTLDDPAAA